MNEETKKQMNEQTIDNVDSLGLECMLVENGGSPEH